MDIIGSTPIAPIMSLWLKWIERLATDQKNGGSSPSRDTINSVPVAQRIERWPPEPDVPGSNPGGDT